MMTLKTSPTEAKVQDETSAPDALVDLKQQAMKDYFSSVSEIYSKHRPTYPARLFDTIAKLTSCHNLAWDVATGTGQTASEMADRYAQVIATDGSASQLAHAIRKPNISYRVLRIEQPETMLSREDFPFKENSVDAITISQALHWFPDLKGFHGLVANVLAPGGLYAVWTYNVPPGPASGLPAAFCTQLHDLYDRVLGPYWDPERYLIETGYATMDFSGLDEVQLAEEDEALRQMPVTWRFENFWGYIQSWSSSTKAKQVNGPDFLDAFELPLKEAWALPDDQARTFYFPLTVRFFRKPADSSSQA